MAWRTTRERQKQLPPAWPKIRAAVLARDGYACTSVEHGERCSLPANQVHHAGAGNDHSLDALVSLCDRHHDRLTAQQGNAARWARDSERRPLERHPGMVEGSDIKPRPRPGPDLPPADRLGPT
jgi:5-methylcytosine-specific restriction protein A